MARPRKTAAPATAQGKPEVDQTNEFDRPEKAADAVAANHDHAIPAVASTPPPDTDTPAAPAKLKDFIAHHEQAAQALGIVVASITHPDAEPGIKQGQYSGIRMFEGEPAARYSDGTKH